MFIEDNFINKAERYNYNNSRSVKNTPYWAYNCFGYAFNTYFCERLYWFRYTSTVEELNKRAKILTEEILSMFPDYILITEKELKDYRKQDVIAFRISYEDFHFIVRRTNNCWYYKQGITKGIHRMTEKEVLSPEWKRNDGAPSYNSNIYFFTKSVE